MTRAFNLDRVRIAEGTGIGTGRSYFVTRLLREVILSEEALAENDPLPVVESLPAT